MTHRASLAEFFLVLGIAALVSLVELSLITDLLAGVPVSRFA